MVPPDGYDLARRHAKKDTRHWCKGRVGVGHQWTIVDYWQLRGAMWMSDKAAWLMDYCTVCGKTGQTIGEICLAPSPIFEYHYQPPPKSLRNRSADEIMELQTHRQ